MRIKPWLACLAAGAVFVLGAARPADAAATAAVAADAVEHHYVFAGGGVRIEVLAQGSGRPLVLLPSRGRGAQDFDQLAQRFAQAGYRVLRPQPRGIGGSIGPMRGATLHDYADDMAAVIEDVARQPVVMVGHAFGNWVARATAVDHPEWVRGVVIVAAAAKQYPPGLSQLVDRSSDLSLPDAERLKAIQDAFFAPGHDARVWLGGWYPEVNESQNQAGKATRQADWWSGGKAPMLDLQADLDKFKPPATRGEVRDEFGQRVTVAVIRGAGHALVPEAPQAVADAVIGWERGLPDRP
ncbi:MAG TPA: alpha/beta hydrolase [Bordetella sp.]